MQDGLEATEFLLVIGPKYVQRRAEIDLKRIDFYGFKRDKIRLTVLEQIWTELWRLKKPF